MSRFTWNQRIFGTNYKFKVHSNGQKTESVIKEWIQKSTAVGRFQMAPNGLSCNGQWVSFVRNYQRRSKESYAECFSNKVLYLIGDSTMRQFFEYMARLFPLNVKHTNGDKFYHAPRVGLHEKSNITIYYRAHGPPIRNPGPLSTATYITDVINEIKTGGKDVAIVINLGLHYIEYDPMFFIHRLQNVKKALQNHLEKFPETRIIVKGLNVAELKTLPLEWLVLRYDVLLREILADLKNAVFVDLWDMSTLWPLTVDYHPNDAMIEEQCQLIFSYVCD